MDDKDQEKEQREIAGVRWLLVCLALYLSALMYGLDTTIAADIQGAVISTFRRCQSTRLDRCRHSPRVSRGHSPLRLFIHCIQHKVALHRRHHPVSGRICPLWRCPDHECADCGPCHCRRGRHGHLPRRPEPLLGHDDPSGTERLPDRHRFCVGFGSNPRASCRRWLRRVSSNLEMRVLHQPRHRGRYCSDILVLLAVD